MAVQDVSVFPLAYLHLLETAVTWEREFFFLAGSVLLCRLASLDGGALSDGHTYCKYGLIVGELAYGAEMHLVLKESGMLPAQRLARLAKRLLVVPLEPVSGTQGPSEGLPLNA